MSLGKKITFVLVLVTTIVLTTTFWVVVSIEGSNIEKQVKNTSETIGDILLDDISRMFLQMHAQEDHLQSAVDKLSKIEGVKYIDVTDTEGVYVATTDHTLVGARVESNDLDLINRIKEDGNAINIQKDEGSFYELERRIPIYLQDDKNINNIIDIIEVEVATKSKSRVDVLEAQKLLQTISVGIEQSARSIVITRQEDLNAIQKITDNVAEFGFFHDFIVFDTNLNIIANTRKEKEGIEKDDEEYKNARKDVLSGKIANFSGVRIHEGLEVIMRVEPIKFVLDGKTETIGLIEIHTLTSSYKDRINTLRIRMAGIGLVFIAVLVITLSIFLRREIVGPITRYSRIAQKVAEGDLSQVIENTSDDEIGKFGEVFNLMVANLREFDRLKSDFISVAAHQLRTPLSGIKWVLKLLLDGDLGSVSLEQSKMLKRGYDTNEKMIQLVNDLLNVSRIENGKFGYKFEKNDFMKIMKLIIENSQLASRERNIEVVMETHAELAPFFFDAEKLLIALQNLVDNAIKYTLPGGRVTITTEKQGDYLQVKIKDTGVGIPKEDIHKLFSKFFRAANVVHLQTDGSGLGLFIVKNIITRHGGQVWVDSEETKGTTFTVLIPLIQDLVPAEQKIESSK
ncbi:MAG: HAMP domain-containing histidine kinase [Candidatus Yonathbacteria bacterium]|nr:HAMP domain-containing histidine kinase [Candidatus Yonathbacteria bacterium]